MLSVIKLSVVMLSVVMLSVVMLNGVAPLKNFLKLRINSIRIGWGDNIVSEIVTFLKLAFWR